MGYEAINNEKFLNAATIVATDDSYRTPEIPHADPKEDPTYGES